MRPTERYVRAHLLVRDRAALDLAAVRAAAARRGWDVEVRTVGGAPASTNALPVGDGAAAIRFAAPLVLHLVARPGAPEVDAAALMRASPGLALDELGRRPDPR